MILWLAARTVGWTGFDDLFAIGVALLVSELTCYAVRFLAIQILELRGDYS